MHKMFMSAKRRHAIYAGRYMQADEKCQPKKSKESFRHIAFGYTQIKN